MSKAIALLVVGYVCVVVVLSSVLRSCSIQRFCTFKAGHFGIRKTHSRVRHPNLFGNIFLLYVDKFIQIVKLQILGLILIVSNLINEVNETFLSITYDGSEGSNSFSFKVHLLYPFFTAGIMPEYQNPDPDPPLIRLETDRNLLL